MKRDKLKAEDIENEINAGFVNWIELDYGQTFPIVVMTKEEIEDQDAAFLYDYLFLAEDPYDAFEEVNVDGVTYFQRKGK